MPELKHRRLPVTLLRTVDLNVTLFNFLPLSSTDRTFPSFLIKKFRVIFLHVCPWICLNPYPFPHPFWQTQRMKGASPFRVQPPWCLDPTILCPGPEACPVSHSLALPCLYPSLSMVIVTFLFIFRYVQIFSICRSLLHLDYLSFGKMFFPLCALSLVIQPSVLSPKLGFPSSCLPQSASHHSYRF